jgi:hypothetical protein
MSGLPAKRRALAGSLLLLLAAALAAPVPVSAQNGPPPVVLRGYLKTLPLYFGAASPGLTGWNLPDGGLFDYTRLRTGLRAESLPGLYLNATAELAVWAGEVKAAGLTGENAAFPVLVDARWDLTQSDHLRADLFLDRLNLEGYAGSWSVVLGRQRIAWGSGFFWNPTDVFNPYGPLALDPEDRPGVDALRVDWQFGTVGALTLAHAVTRRPGYSDRYTDRSATVVRLGTGLGSYDVHVMASFDRRERMFGLDVTGYVGGTGIHLEAARIHSPVWYTYGIGDELEESGILAYWRDWSEVVAGAAYGFGDGTSLQVEWFHNTGGATDPEDYEVLAVAVGRLLAVGRDYGVVALSRPLTSLLTGSLAVLVNAGDGSAALVPGFDWSLGQNARLLLGVQSFTGPDRSEFGPLPVIGYTLLRLSF